MKRGMRRAVSRQWIRIAIENRGYEQQDGGLTLGRAFQ